MTTIIMTPCLRCGRPAAAYLTKRMLNQILLVNGVDAELSLQDADTVDVEEQSSGEVDDARQLHERMGHHWFDSREGPGRCGCGEEIDIVELLSHMARHYAECQP